MLATKTTAPRMAHAVLMPMETATTACAMRTTLVNVARSVSIIFQTLCKLCAVAADSADSLQTLRTCCRLYTLSRFYAESLQTIKHKEIN